MATGKVPEEQQPQQDGADDSCVAQLSKYASSNFDNVDLYTAELAC